MRFHWFHASLALLGLLAPAQGGEPVSLAFDDLEAFRATEGWSVAGAVEGDREEKRWAKLEEGTGILVNGSEGKAGNLLTRMEHGDVELEVEFMIPKGSNSGIYFQGRYEVQILDSHGKADSALTVHDCGAIYERWDEEREPKGYEGHVPAANACKPPGEWQSFQVKFRAPRFDASGNKTENARFLQVIHNGKVIHEDAEIAGPTRGGLEPEVARGPFKIQGDHGPVAFRKFAVKSLEE